MGRADGDRNLTKRVLQEKCSFIALYIIELPAMKFKGTSNTLI